MKTTEKTTKARVPARPAPAKPRLLEASELLLTSVRKKNLIRWPGDRQLKEVSVKLARIAKIGKRAEAKGDYFNSGDLAYQIQQVIEATEDLLKKSQRIQ